MSSQSRRSRGTIFVALGPTQEVLHGECRVDGGGASRKVCEDAANVTAQRIDGATVEAVNAFVRALAPAALPPIAHILLFGSRARGDFGEESDVDVAVVLARRGGTTRMQIDREVRKQTYQARADFDFAVSPIVLWQDSLADPDSTDNPVFYRSIAREGIEWEWKRAHS